MPDWLPALSAKTIAFALGACVIEFSAALTAFRLIARLIRVQGSARWTWIMLAALAGGSGMWASSMLLVLGTGKATLVGFEPFPMMLSLVVAMFGVGVSTGVGTSRRGLDAAVASALTLGATFAAVHMIAMLAGRFDSAMRWEGGWIAAAVTASVGLALLSQAPLARPRSTPNQLVAAALLMLAPLTVHGLSATGLGVLARSGVTDGQLLSPGVVTVAVLMVAGLVIAGVMGALAVDEQGSRNALSRMRRLADASFEGIVVLDGGRINDANTAFVSLVGTSVEALRGRPLLGEVLCVEGALDISAGDVRREGELRLADGSTAPVEVYARGMTGRRRADEQRELTILAIRDLRERRSAEERIRYLAEHDGLTGLPNRATLQQRLTAALARSDETGLPVAVLCLDLDHFKEANDLHGHLAGDALLIETARRLQAVCGPNAFAARLGGDEFVVVQAGEADQPAAAGALAQDVLTALQASLPFEGRMINTGASVGVSLYPEDSGSVDGLLANADMALYRAKEEGRGVFRFFRREMDETIRERRALARELRTAIAQDQLVLHYQPLASAANGQVCGFEALVRWNHPERGLLPPVAFIGVAEECGLIGPLGEWVLRRACADAAAWPRPLRIAVNLSPLQLNQPGLVELVHQTLIDTGLSPQRLELEVTETALFKDFQRALDVLRRLKALGVRIAMDDFGTGFSSLSTLQSFPFDKIKIDKSFVEQIHRDDRATVIVRAVLGLGRSLSIPVVAEGVETEAQWAFLRAEDCDQIQGYAIGRPTPLGLLGPFVEAAEPATAEAEPAPAKPVPRRAEGLRSLKRA